MIQARPATDNNLFRSTNTELVPPKKTNDNTFKQKIIRIREFFDRLFIIV